MRGHVCLNTRGIKKETPFQKLTSMGIKLLFNPVPVITAPTLSQTSLSGFQWRATEFFKTPMLKTLALEGRRKLVINFRGIR